MKNYNKERLLQTATWIKFGIAIILYSVYENMTNSSVIGVVP